MRRWTQGLLGALALAGCSYTFDGEAPELPLLGSAPATAQGSRLNRGPAGNAAVVQDGRGTNWAVFDELAETEGGVKPAVRFVRLAEGPGPAEVLVTEEDFVLNWDGLYLFERGKVDEPGAKTILTLRLLGEENARTFELPPGPGVLLPDATNRVFAYVPTAVSLAELILVRTDGSYSRRLPLPSTASSVRFEDFSLFFMDASRALVVRTPEGKLLSLATTPEGGDRDLSGEAGRPRRVRYDAPRRQLVSCGQDGLRAFGIDEAGAAPPPDRVLDPEPCDEQGDLLFRRDQAVYQRDLPAGAPSPGPTLRVPLDGREAPAPLLPAGQRLLAIGPDDALVHSLDPADRYVQGAGDGHLADWRFMERGRAVSFSADGQTLRWLEHAAKPGGIGDLLSARRDVPGSPALRLARNVRQYGELSDGRVLACANRAFRGTQNRVVVIDEARREARWVAAQAAEYVRVPGTNELLVDVITGPSSFDVVRVAIPPKE